MQLSRQRSKKGLDPLPESGTAELLVPQVADKGVQAGCSLLESVSTESVSRTVVTEESIRDCLKSSPAEVIPSVRQRALEQRQKYPRSSLLICATLVHNFVRAHEDPKTSEHMPKYCVQNKKFLKLVGIYSRLEDEKPGDELCIKLVRKICLLKAKKKYDKIRPLIAVLRKRFSLRSIAKKAAIRLSHLQWAISQGKPKTAPRKVTSEDIARVRFFFGKATITMQLPYKRYGDYYYLRSTFDASYKKYVEFMKSKKYRVLSQTAVRNALPKGKFKPLGRIPYQQCLCNACSNYSLLVSAGHNAGVKGISRGLTDNCLLSVCQKSNVSNDVITDIRNVNRACLNRQCIRCQHKFSELITESNPNLDLSRKVVWRQWEAVYEEDKKTKKRKRVDYDRFVHKGPLADLLGLLKLQTVNFPLHMFHFRWQAYQFEECKATLRKGELLLVMDFAKNIGIDRQMEVQMAFFYRKQATLHPMVCFYRCPTEGCDQLVTDEVMCISPDTEHDSHMVRTCEKCLVKYLYAKHIVIDKMIQFTDNCSAQYKSFRPFDYLSRSVIPTERAYFGSEHGKGPGDGFTGRTKVMVDRAIRSKQVGITDAHELYSYLSSEKSTDKCTPGTCQHYARNFIYVPEVNRDHKAEATTLAGTQMVHSVRSTGTPGILDVRLTSCMCVHCRDQDPCNCKNKATVPGFHRKNVFKRATILKVSYNGYISNVSNGLQLFCIKYV